MTDAQIPDITLLVDDPPIVHWGPNWRIQGNVYQMRVERNIGGHWSFEGPPEEAVKLLSKAAEGLREPVIDTREGFDNDTSFVMLGWISPSLAEYRKAKKTAVERWQNIQQREADEEAARVSAFIKAHPEMVKDEFLPKKRRGTGGRG